MLGSESAFTGEGGFVMHNTGKAARSASLPVRRE